jgi:hypothetical protein
MRLGLINRREGYQRRGLQLVVVRTAAAVRVWLGGLRTKEAEGFVEIEGCTDERAV